MSLIGEPPWKELEGIERTRAIGEALNHDCVLEVAEGLYEEGYTLEIGSARALDLPSEERSRGKP